MQRKSWNQPPSNTGRQLISCTLFHHEVKGHRRERKKTRRDWGVGWGLASEAWFPCKNAEMTPPMSIFPPSLVQSLSITFFWRTTLRLYKVYFLAKSQTPSKFWHMHSTCMRPSAFQSPWGQVKDILLLVFCPPQRLSWQQLGSYRKRQGPIFPLPHKYHLNFNLPNSCLSLKSSLKLIQISFQTLFPLRKTRTLLFSSNGRIVLWLDL